MKPGSVEERLDRIERDMDRRLRFGTHFDAEEKVITVTGDSVDVDVKLTKLRGRPLYVLCGMVEQVGSPDSPGNCGGLLAAKPQTVSGGKGIRISNFPGLGAGTEYRVPILVIGGEP
jgi:hypothetical protein